MAGVVYLLLIVVAANLGRRRRGWPFSGRCLRRKAAAPQAPDRGPRPVPRSQWRGPLRRSRRRGERPNYLPRPSVNLRAGFIFTSTAWTPRRSPPSSPASRKATWTRAVVAAPRLVRAARGGDLLRPAMAVAGVRGPPGRL